MLMYLKSWDLISLRTKVMLAPSKPQAVIKAPSEENPVCCCKSVENFEISEFLDL
jgi:hypothetical protein